MEFRLPNKDEVFPRPFVDARLWEPWKEATCTKAVFAGICREIYDTQNREPNSADNWAYRQGEIAGLKKALRVFKEEEDASRPKVSDSVEGV